MCFRITFTILIVATFTFIMYQTNRVTQLTTPIPPPHHQNSTSPPSNNPIANNLPSIYNQTIFGFNIKFNKTCAQYPNLFDIHFNNDHWQTQTNNKTTLHLLNAYYDNRFTPTIRIISMLDSLKVNQSFYCQYWYSNHIKPKIVRNEGFIKPWIDAWGPKTNKFSPYIFNCPVKGIVPDSVSLVENPCDHATNNLRVIHPKKVDVKKEFVVCVKGLNFPFKDVSVRLVEWMELLFILGVDKINIYYFQVHPNIRKVLEYYQLLGKVEATPISLVGEYSNQAYLQDLFLHKKTIERRLQEVIPYNDCFYKHMHEYNWVVLHDIDEIVVPVEGNWFDMMQATLKVYPDPNIATFLARNIYFWDNPKHEHDWIEGIPIYLHVMQHVYRSKEYTKPGHYVKGFHRTSKVIGLHNHFPMACQGKLNKCVSIHFSTNITHLQHYREDCVRSIKTKECEDYKLNTVADLRVMRFANQLINNVNKTLDYLEIVPEEGVIF